jgi:hypothetical protein
VVDRYVPQKNSSHKASAEVLVQPGTGAVRAMVVERSLGPSEKIGKTWVNFAADGDHGTSLGARTSPGGGARVEPGSTVTIYVSRGRPNRPGPPGIPPPCGPRRMARRPSPP